MLSYADELVEFNGETMAVKDIPDPFIRAMSGYGHFPSDIARRQVHNGFWPYTPSTCLTDEFNGQGVWVKDGTALACRGCGMDFT